MLNYIAIIIPFKLQWVTIVEKSGAFGLAENLAVCLANALVEEACKS